MSLTRTTWSRSNSASRFSLDEVNTHDTWIDGKQIYRRVVNVAPLPNATVKSVQHNTRNIDKVLSLQGFAYNETQWISYPNSDIDLSLQGAFLEIDPGAANYSAYTEGMVVIHYTKNV